MTPDNMPTKAQAVKVHWELTRTRYALIHQLVYLRLQSWRSIKKTEKYVALSFLSCELTASVFLSI